MKNKARKNKAGNADQVNYDYTIITNEDQFRTAFESALDKKAFVEGFKAYKATCLEQEAEKAKQEAEYTAMLNEGLNALRSGMSVSVPKELDDRLKIALKAIEIDSSWAKSKGAIVDCALATLGFYPWQRKPFSTIERAECRQLSEKIMDTLNIPYGKNTVKVHFTDCPVMGERERKEAFNRTFPNNPTA